MIGPEIKVFFFKHPISNTTYPYLTFHVRLCVWSIFWPPFHQAISNLSTNLDPLNQVGGNKTVCRVMGPEIKFFLSRTLFSIVLPLPSTSCPFVCLINLLTPFLSSYFKSKHSFRLLGPGRSNKTVCRVMGLEIKICYYQGPFHQ